MTDANAMTTDEVADVVMRLMAQHIKQDGAGWSQDTELAAIGIDSFDFVEFVFLLEEEFGIEIDYNANDMSKSLTTIGAVALSIKTVAAKGAAEGGTVPDPAAPDPVQKIQPA